METKNIMSIIVVALVGAVVLAGFLPVLGSTASGLGPEVEYSNGNAYYTFKLAEKSGTYEFKVNGTGNPILMNDEELTDKGFTIVTDTVTVFSEAGRINVYTPVMQYDIRPSYNSIATVTFDNGTVTLSFPQSQQTLTYTYEWMFAPDDNGEWTTVTNFGIARYVNSINDIMFSGYYATGENDTHYQVINGVVSVTEDYTSGWTYTLAPVDGMTDVYTIKNIKIQVGDEEFEPWFGMIKDRVVGHEASGAMYDIYTLIPVILACGLVMFVITAILIRRV